MKSEVVFALDHAGWPALLVDSGGVILRANPSAIKVFGSVVEGEKPLLAAIWTEGFGPSAEQFLANWERSPIDSVLLKFRIKGGGASLFSVSLCSFSKDEQKYFIFQLLPGGPAHAPGHTEVISAHKQKLECALQLARTMAHDFNNAITGILGHTSLLLGQTPPNHPWRHSLVQVEKAAARAAEIAGDLSAFSRQEKKEPREQSAGNLNSLAQRSIDAARAARPEPIEWQAQPGRHLFAAKFDEPKLLQAMSKILDNAADAITANGRVTVQTRNVELAEAAQDRNLRLAAGNYVCIEIIDNGAGIDPEVLPRVFEPFFTTKKDGRHRGLGLALVYGIITNHGGGVAISSQPGAGTSVRIYLPAEKKIVRDHAPAASDLHGTQTVLMVDDEELMLSVGQAILSTFGYRVLTANSGQKALEIISRGEPLVDLVITDLVMPSMSGRELAEHVSNLSPHTRVLRISGIARTGNTDDETTFLQKPFSSHELLVKVKRALTVRSS
ncbi:MAG: ATP-binding protein [Verrucomicrobiota bacterium]